MSLIDPHGGVLCDLYVSGEESKVLTEQSVDFPSWDLTLRQVCDLELLLSGAFSPLNGFLGQADYDGVVESMRLVDGTLWSMPITLDVTEDFAADVSQGQSVALRDGEGVMLAVLDVEDIWRPDRVKEARKVFGSEDTTHPGVDYLLNHGNAIYLGGKVRGVEAPTHYDYGDLRMTPSQTRQVFSDNGWQRVVAFQTRNPMHRAHVELTERAAKQVDAHLLVQPVVGMTKPGDIDHHTRVRCYEKVMAAYPEKTAMLSLLPLAMRMGGPREALWHAIIRKNYGCTHFIVGRDHAGPGKNSDGEDFYGPYDAQELVTKFQAEIGIEMVPFQMVVYLENRQCYVPIDEATESDSVLNISGTDFRRKLRSGEEIPEWFSYPEVVDELRKAYPQPNKQGFTLFFTGLSGAGKSTIANATMVKLMEIGGRSVTLLDGDLVRKNLSSELGFSKEHRDLNVTRIGYVASEITKAGGIAVCAPIAPYADVRRKVRDEISQYGAFFEIHVATPIDVCEQRDRKGLYAKARAGLIKGFTGIDDPYQAPVVPELKIDTTNETPDTIAASIINFLKDKGYV